MALFKCVGDIINEVYIYKVCPQDEYDKMVAVTGGFGKGVIQGANRVLSNDGDFGYDSHIFTNNRKIKIGRCNRMHISCGVGNSNVNFCNFIFLLFKSDGTELARIGKAIGNGDNWVVDRTVAFETTEDTEVYVEIRCTGGANNATWFNLGEIKIFKE